MPGMSTEKEARGGVSDDSQKKMDTCKACRQRDTQHRDRSTIRRSKLSFRVRFVGGDRGRSHLYEKAYGMSTMEIRGIEIAIERHVA